MVLDIATIEIEVEHSEALDGLSEPLARLRLFECKGSGAPPLRIRMVPWIEHPPHEKFHMRGNALFYHDSEKGVRYFMSNEMCAVLDWPARRLDYTVNVEGGGGAQHLTAILLMQVRLLVSFAVLENGGIPLHSSCVFKNGKALVFFGSPGIGKTTIAGRMAQAGWAVANDDLNVMMPVGDTMKAFATPFCKLPVQRPSARGGLDIAGAFCLAWGDNRVADLSHEQQVRAVLGCMYAYPDFDCFGEKMIENAARFCSWFKPRQLYFRNNDGIVPFLEKLLLEGE